MKKIVRIPETLDERKKTWRKLLTQVDKTKARGLTKSDTLKREKLHGFRHHKKRTTAQYKKGALHKITHL
jgi:hypothetical protein